MEKVRERRLLSFSHSSADMMAGIVILSPLQAIVKMVLKTRPDVEKEQKINK